MPFEDFHLRDRPVRRCGNPNNNLTAASRLPCQWRLEQWSGVKHPKLSMPGKEGASIDTF